MALFTSTNFQSLEQLLIDQLQDLYDAEQRITKALPQMADAADNPRLKAGFTEHLRQTEQQIARLEQVFKMLGQPTKGKTCHAMKGLVEEGQEVISATGDPAVKDAALIAAAQRVEHYEIAGYGTVRTFAQHLGRADIANILEQTLAEEKATDQKLTALAEEKINVQASH